MKTHVQKSVFGLGLVILGALPVAACYGLWSRSCGPCTLTDMAGVSPAVPVSCTDPGDNYVTYKSATTGQTGLQSVDWECTYACLGVDVTGMVTKSLPSSPPSSCDYPVSTFAPVGPNCGG